VAHVAQLPQFGTLHHHAWLLQELYQQTLPLEPGMTILDLGCGTGDFARSLVMNHIYRLAHTSMTPQQPVRYLGIDRSGETLQAAEQAFETLYRELQSTFSDVAAPAQALLTTWSQSEWDVQLPCAPQSIHRIVGHLSLSFTASPLAFLRQAVQALTPDGRLVLTCLQPHTDLAGLYRDQLHLAGQDELSPSAQIFLHYLGRLREAVRHGLLHSFDREQLSDLLLHAGAGPLRIVPVLDGQLLLATARKGKSAG
jgi:SAM-dependent methyltransferase